MFNAVGIYLRNRGCPVRVKHDVQMHHGQSRGKPKN